MLVLGISAFYHDSAAALVDERSIIAAAQEERFSRKKHDAAFPRRAIGFCLEQARCSLGDLDLVVFYDKPFLKFERLLESYVALAPRGFSSFKTAMPLWIKQKFFQKDILAKALRAIDAKFDTRRLLFTEHHLSHAASAFLASPFQAAAVLTMDGVGEWATTSLGQGSGNYVEIHKEIHFPHSLGLLYSAFTYYTGFKVNSGEYKVMGLAPYGEPTYARAILDNLIDLKEDGSFRLNLEYFDYCTGLRMTNDKFAALFGRPARVPEQELLIQFHMDIAASIQAVTDEIVVRLARTARAHTSLRHLCMAGGVALNCVTNGKIAKAGIFDEIWIQPAAGDAGGALGAALAGVHLFNKAPRRLNGGDLMAGAYLGPEFSQSDMEQRLTNAGARFEVLSDNMVINCTAHALAQGSAVGWMQGRMEFGPRALGNRSIVADPRSPSMQKKLNLKVKYRESFRPFAPSVLREDLQKWFELESDSPYMLLVAAVRREQCRDITADERALFGIDRLNVPRSTIPAVTHVDNSARIQTVHSNTNPRFHALISRFKDLTGCGVLVNTSFNVRGEPIVCTPEDAFRCFMGSEIDLLVAGNCVLRKELQNPELKFSHEISCELDERVDTRSAARERRR